MKKCGDANPDGGVWLLFKGGCGEKLRPKDEYRCLGCDGYFHRDCLFNHFELEKNQDYSRFALRKILDLAQKKMWDMGEIIKLAKEGLERKPAGKSFNFPKTGNPVDKK